MQLAAITREQFADKAWRRPAGYPSAAQSNILPVVVSELVKLVPVMPLGFVKTEAIFQLVAITSLQSGVNYFVAPDGRWLGDYMPATLRAYPFRLVKPQDRDEKVLCFDNSEGLLCDVGEEGMDCHAALSMNHPIRHRERSAAIHDSKMHGLPRYSLS